MHRDGNVCQHFLVSPRLPRNERGRLRLASGSHILYFEAVCFPGERPAVCDLDRALEGRRQHDDRITAVSPVDYDAIGKGRSDNDCVIAWSAEKCRSTVRSVALSSHSPYEYLP